MTEEQMARQAEKVRTFAARFGRAGIPYAEARNLLGLDRVPEVPIPQDLVLRPLEVTVRDGRLDKAMRLLKKKMAAEGVLKEIKKRRRHMKPSEKRRKKRLEAARKRRKHARSRGE